MTFAVKKISLALLFLFKVLILTAAIDIRDFECELFLLDLNRTDRASTFAELQTFLGFKYESLPEGAGFLFGPRYHLDQAPRIHYVLGSTPASVFRTEIWRAQNREFQFVDVGFKSLEWDSMLIHRAIAWHIRHHPQSTMQVELSPVQSSYRQWLAENRWSFHDAVLAKYFAAKGYLRDVDRYLLELPNRRSSNNDVFAILDRHGESPDLSTASSVKRDLLISIQVSYFGAREFFEPSAAELVNAHVFGPIQPGENFPFEFRLDSSQKKEFLTGLYNRFDMTRTAEVTRYARFAKIPWSIHARLLDTTIRTAVSRGMRTLLVSADASTERLFRRYGFKRYGILPARQTFAPEYLMYMEMPSPEYDRFLLYLRTSMEN